MSLRPSYSYTIGLAYIALPSDIERADYIKDCFLNSQVSIIDETGGFYNRIPISPEVLNFINFPNDPNERGTPVIYGTEETLQQQVVLARLQERSELGDGREYQFKFRRKFQGQVVEMSGSAKEKAINLLVNGDSEAAQLNISVMSRNSDSKVNIEVAGDLTAKATGNVAFEQQKTFSSTTIDPDSEDEATFEQTTTQHNFKNKKLVVNEGTDPLVLGNELKSLLSDFIDQVAAIKTVTSLGLQPIVNKASVQALKKRLDSILSKVVFTDK